MDEDQQEKYLEEAKKIVKEQGFFMKRALREANLKDGLRFASVMISELKTSLLSPQSYYIIFMQVFDELRSLEQHFKEEYRKGRRMQTLYESVQHATSVIPRLYLLVTVGAVYIETHEISAKEIISDLLEMVKGVQHPMRGLFLRYYLLKMIKDKLPDVSNDYEILKYKEQEKEGEGEEEKQEGEEEEKKEEVDLSLSCTVQNSIEYIMKNLSEMNKLWTRMQGNKKNSRREKERQDLKVLVGENVTRLSHLEGVDCSTYKEQVLPRLTDLITSNKDRISQQYLVEVLILAFPDEFHLQNLDVLLEMMSRGLVGQVDVKSAFIRLMDRLAEYANSSPQLEGQEHIFGMFQKHIDILIEQASDDSLEGCKKLLDLQAAFLKFTLNCYPSQSEYVDQVLKSCVSICAKIEKSLLDESCFKNIVKFLTFPLETIGLAILQMNQYPVLMQYLPFAKRKLVSNRIVLALVGSKRPIESLQVTAQLIQFILPVLHDQLESGEELADYEFTIEQQNLARLLHLVSGEQDQVLQMLGLFQEEIVKGGSRKVVLTVPALVYNYLKLARRVDSSVEGHPLLEIYRRVTLLNNLLQDLQPKQYIRLNLELALSIDQNRGGQEDSLDEMVYDLLSESLLALQSAVGDQQEKQEYLAVFVTTLSRLHCLSQDNYDTLASNVCQACTQLLKKHEQCAALVKTLHLFHNAAQNNPAKLNEVFKKAFKLAQTESAKAVTHMALYIGIMLEIITLEAKSFQVKPEFLQNILDAFAAREKEISDLGLLAKWHKIQKYMGAKKEAGEGAYSGLQL